MRKGVDLKARKSYNMLMDNWVLLGPGMVEKREQSESGITSTQVKVKVSHVLVSNFDAYCFTGEKKISYPKTPGRFAIGIVTELGKDCFGVEKGARVCLNSVRPCGKCLSCRTGNKYECEHVNIAGIDFDGFLRDFVVCEYTDVTVIPDSVDDLHALCIEHVALAENIFDKLALPAGASLAIVGGGFVGSILSQIALYHKLVPIIIDNNAKNIERLKKSGVFYAFGADDAMMANLNDATSGSLCDAAIYTSCCKLTSTVPSSALAHGKDLVLGGFCTVNFNMDVRPLFEKSLRMYAVSDGYGYNETALNMLVHGAIDLSNFEKEILSEFDVAKLYAERAEKASYTAKMTVLKLIM